MTFNWKKSEIIKPINNISVPVPGKPLIPSYEKVSFKQSITLEIFFKLN